MQLLVISINALHLWRVCPAAPEMVTAHSIRFVDILTQFPRSTIY